MKGIKRNKKLLGLILLSVLGVQFSMLQAQEAMNRPYIDDKLFHFGFQIGLNFTSFGVTDRDTTLLLTNKDGITQDYVPHARVSGVTPLLNIGFVTDLRLSKHVNLRFTPGLQFSSRTLNYKFCHLDQADPSKNDTIDLTASALAIPIYFPLYLKFSADRQGNYRPYVIAGGGVSVNVNKYDKNKDPIHLNLMDYFCEVGFGVDLYLPWFKLCPEITYRIGFADQLNTQGPDKNKFYSDAISHLYSHCICLTFNFE